jgi:hypothetical protein
MKILFRAYFHQKNFQKKVGWKFIRVRIRIRIRTISKVGSGSGSGQKSSGSATLGETLCSSVAGYCLLHNTKFLELVTILGWTSADIYSRVWTPLKCMLLYESADFYSRSAHHILRFNIFLLGSLWTVKTVYGSGLPYLRDGRAVEKVFCKNALLNNFVAFFKFISQQVSRI